MSKQPQPLPTKAWSKSELLDELQQKWQDQQRRIESVPAPHRADSSTVTEARYFQDRIHRLQETLRAAAIDPKAPVFDLPVRHMNGGKPTFATEELEKLVKVQPEKHPVSDPTERQLLRKRAIETEYAERERKGLRQPKDEHERAIEQSPQATHERTPANEPAKKPTLADAVKQATENLKKAVTSAPELPAHVAAALNKSGKEHGVSKTHDHGRTR